MKTSSQASFWTSHRLASHGEARWAHRPLLLWWVGLVHSGLLCPQTLSGLFPCADLLVNLCPEALLLCLVVLQIWPLLAIYFSLLICPEQRKPGWILVEITLNLWINRERINTSLTLTLLLHGHSTVLHLLRTFKNVFVVSFSLKGFAQLLTHLLFMPSVGNVCCPTRGICVLPSLPCITSEKRWIGTLWISLYPPCASNSLKFL